MIKKIPRKHQQEAYTAIIKDIALGERPYAHMSTGSGKALVCAMLVEKCRKQGGRALVLVPSSELVSQNAKEFHDYTDDVKSYGICSAKLRKNQVTRQIVFATYTSFLKRRATSGSFNILIIDEAHYVSPNPDTSYQKIIRSLLRINPNMKICGLTATPYREKQGYIHLDCVEGKATFTRCCYETNIPDLIKKGYLSHVESISGDIEADLTGVKLKSNGDYNDEEMGQRFENIVIDATKDMRVKFDHYNINTAIVYASNLSNARKIVEEWNDDSTIRLAYGDMPNSERNALTKWLKHGEGRRIVVNVGIFVTGFDYTQLDCVVLFLATKSLVKYVQICGRVIRAHDDKELGYVLCFGGNIDRHGPIDATIAPKNKKRVGDAPRKSCIAIVEETTEFEDLVYRKGDVCGYSNILSAKKCKVCHAEFVTDSETGKYVMRTSGEILKAKIDAETYNYDVSRVTFEKAYSKKDQTEMIKLNFIDESGFIFHNYYLCLNHQGYARHKCITHLLQMMKAPENYPLIASAPGGVNVENVLLLFSNAYDKYFKRFETITLAPSGKYKELKGWQFVN